MPTQMTMRLAKRKYRRKVGGSRGGRGSGAATRAMRTTAFRSTRGRNVTTRALKQGRNLYNAKGGFRGSGSSTG